MARDNQIAIPSPWADFLRELDAALPEKTDVHCFGGFVLSFHYGLPRPTGDIDYYAVMPVQSESNLLELACETSPLARKYKLCVQHVAINTLPEDYESRLMEMFPGQFSKLRLLALDPYDLILSKLERNITRDRDDAEYLARTCHLKPEILQERYQKEMRPYLVNEARHDLTLKLLLESCFPQPPSTPSTSTT